MSNNTNLYNKVSNVDYSSNKKYLSSIYAPNKEIQYYNDPKDIKKKKNKKIRKILTLGFSAVSVLSLVGILVTQIIKNKVKPSDIKEMAVNLYDTAKKNTDEIIDKTTKNKQVKKITNALVNFSNAKDDYWTRFSKWLKSKKIGFIDNANGKLADVYRDLSKNKYQKSFDEALEQVRKHQGDLTIDGLPKNFESWYSAMDEAIQKGLNKDGHITKGLITKETLTSKEGFSKFCHKFTDSIMSEDKLAKTRREFLSKIEVPENASAELEKAIKNLNEIKLKNGTEVFERLRDTNMGNAGTDALGIVTSLGLLGGSLAFSDSKEERKSTVINLGIPLLTTLASAIYGTARCMSGGKALLFGFATGEVASLIAKGIDKLSSKQAAKKKEKQQLQNA